MGGDAYEARHRALSPLLYSTGPGAEQNMGPPAMKGASSRTGRGQCAEAASVGRAEAHRNPR